MQKKQLVFGKVIKKRRLADISVYEDGTFDLTDEEYAELSDRGIIDVLYAVKTSSGISYGEIANRAGYKTIDGIVDVIRGRSHRRIYAKPKIVQALLDGVNASYRLRMFVWLKYGIVPNQFAVSMPVIELMTILSHPMISSKERQIIEKSVTSVLRPWEEALG